jgi:hypothetical protein
MHFHYVNYSDKNGNDDKQPIDPILYLLVNKTDVENQKMLQIK